MRFFGGLTGSLFILAAISGAFFGLRELWVKGPIPWDFFLIALGAGFVFALVQAHRGRNTYWSRLISSAISLSLAGCFIAEAAYSVTVVNMVASPIFIVYVLLAYRLVTTDLRMWRWFKGREVGPSPV